MMRFMDMQDNILTKADHCQYGLIVGYAVRQALSKKPTEFLTNSPCIAFQLRRTCGEAHTQIRGMHVHSEVPHSSPKSTHQLCATPYAVA